MRLHPGITFFNYGIPVSISPDDPGLFGYKGVTIDWYLAAVENLLYLYIRHLWNLILKI